MQAARLARDRHAPNRPLLLKPLPPEASSSTTEIAQMNSGPVFLLNHFLK
jgi:hypothetical protein